MEEGMSIELMTKVWKEADAEGSKLLLLLALADMANEAGYCWPSYETLAKRARISRTHAINIMKELVDSGWIQKEKRYRNGQPTEQTSNGYWIIFPETTQLKNLTTQSTGVTHPSQSQLTPQLTPVNHPQLTGVNPNHHIEPSNEPSHESPVVAQLFSLYESNIGIITPMIVDVLQDAINEYPVEWFEPAIKQAISNNVRKWNYIEAILKRWKIEGLNPLPGKQIEDPKVIATYTEKGELIFVRQKA
jgi:DnaD/phage-associated family protein